MYGILGTTFALDVTVLCREIFMSKDAAEDFLTEELGKYTFLDVMPMERILDIINEVGKHNVLLVPTTSSLYKENNDPET